MLHATEIGLSAGRVSRLGLRTVIPFLLLVFHGEAIKYIGSLSGVKNERINYLYLFISALPLKTLLNGEMMMVVKLLSLTFKIGLFSLDSMKAALLIK